jgi:excisionase family DNA binding protein
MTTASSGNGKSVMMTVEEVAERWGVHPRTIRSAIKKKQITALHVGRLIRISRSHIEFLEANGDRRAL